MIGEIKRSGNIKVVIIQQVIQNILRIEENFLRKMEMGGGGMRQMFFNKKRRSK